MAGNYEIKKVHLSEDFAMLRVPEIEVEGSSIDTLSRAVSKKLPQSFLDNTYVRDVGKTFYEAFMRIDLPTLREIDNISEKRQAFIDSRLPPNVAASNAVNGHLLPIIILDIDIRVGDVILDSDIEYINDILTWVSNKIYVTPLLIFADEIKKDDRIKFYTDFVKRLLENKQTLSSRIRAAASVPNFYSRTKIREALSMYDHENKSPSFVVVDFERSRITSSKMIGVPNSVRRFFTEGKEDEPKYAIYAFNVKPYKKGEENPMAEDLGCYISGISTIGDTYRLTKASRIYIPPAQNLSDLPKVFNPDSYKYIKLDNEIAVSEFKQWYETNTGKQIEAPYSKYAPYTYRFNVHKTGLEVAEISRMIKKGESEELRKRVESKDITKALRGKTF